MAHQFEQDRPDHKVHHMHIPEHHAHMDQKFDKGGRSPMVGQLPIDSGMESPEVSPGVNGDSGGY